MSSSLIKMLLMLSLIACSTSIFAQDSKAVKKVKQILHSQADAWNQGDIDTFMEDYWKSEKLQFIGSKGVTYGWDLTKANYKKNYPNKETMGHLSFDIINVDRQSRKVISLVGKFTLKRSIGDLSGHFLLIFKKIKGQWVIIADHTS